VAILFGGVASVSHLEGEVIQRQPEIGFHSNVVSLMDSLVSVIPMAPPAIHVMSLMAENRVHPQGGRV
jgi:hypothetical protein